MSTTPAHQEGTATDAPPAGRRRGRPPKSEAAGATTRTRLLDAAVDTVVDKGFDGASVTEIAGRAGVTTGAIYAHFDDRAHLIATAARRELARLNVTTAPGSAAAVAVAHAFLSDDFVRNRRFFVELHAAALRDPELATLITEWQRQHAAVMTSWATRPADREVTVKLFFLLLLGLCQLETVVEPSVVPAALVAKVDELVTHLFNG
jgi:AcrR family transcriptional regulator